MRPRGEPVGGDLAGLLGKGAYGVPKVQYRTVALECKCAACYEGDGRRKAKGKGRIRLQVRLAR